MFWNTPSQIEINKSEHKTDISAYGRVSSGQSGNYPEFRAMKTKPECLPMPRSLATS